ncbi:hypothetical protein ON010_g9447 [Phytophthora cinnamomi]|nr:hypothetical protein ON010_g9447 [Phytophthora cinnamomi]
MGGIRAEEDEARCSRPRPPLEEGQAVKTSRASRQCERPRGRASQVRALPGRNYVAAPRFKELHYVLEESRGGRGGGCKHQPAKVATLAAGQHGDKIRDVAMIAAARDGYTQAVKMLKLEVIGRQTGKLDFNSREVLVDAAVAAAATGQLIVVELLLLEIESDNNREGEIYEESDYDSGSDEPMPSHDAAWRVLDEASGRGHLGVVKFAANYALQSVYEPAHAFCDALSLAIAGGHLEVVRFLLEPGRYMWQYAKALELAIDKGHHAIVELMYAMSPQHGGNTFFCRFAIAGNLKVITYLYNNGHNEPKMIDDAFMQAARHGQTDIVAFLLDSGPISPEAFDSGFENAARSGTIATLRFLYGQRRVSRSSLMAAFEKTERPATIEFIHSNEIIPTESVVSAFKNAGRCGYVGPHYHRPNLDQLQILRVLRMRVDIPAEAINEVVAKATLEFHPGILQILSDDSRLTSEIRSVAFAKAIDKGSLRLSQALFKDNQISSEETTQAFVRAACAGHLDLVKFLVVKPVIVESAEREAILASARTNRNGVTQYLCKRKEWPIEVLAEALSATRHKKLKKFLRSIIARRQGGRP